MKKFLLGVLVLTTLLFTVGCDSDNIVNVEDKSTGLASNREVAGYDPTTNILTILDSSGAASFWSVDKFDPATGELIVRNTQTGEILEGVVSNKEGVAVSKLEDTDTFEVEKTTPGTISSSSSNNPSSSVGAESSSSAVMETSALSKYWGDVNGQLIFVKDEGGFQEELEGLEFVENPFGTDSAKYDSREYTHTLRAYEDSVGYAFLVDDNLLIMVPNDLNQETVGDGPWGSIARSASVAVDSAVSRPKEENVFVYSVLNDSTDSDFLRYFTYGYNSFYPANKIIGTFPNQEVSTTNSQSNRNDCYAEGGDNDEDGLPTELDPGCWLPGMGSVMIYNGAYYWHDWVTVLIEHLDNDKDDVNAVVHILKTFRVDPSANLPLHSTNNPLKWATMYLYCIDYEPSGDSPNC